MHLSASPHLAHITSLSHPLLPPKTKKSPKIVRNSYKRTLTHNRQFQMSYLCIVITKTSAQPKRIPKESYRTRTTPSPTHGRCWHRHMTRQTVQPPHQNSHRTIRSNTQPQTQVLTHYHRYPHRGIQNTCHTADGERKQLWQK